MISFINENKAEINLVRAKLMLQTRTKDLKILNEYELWQSNSKKNKKKINNTNEIGNFEKKFNF